MLSYTELLNAYNFQKKRLLAKSTIMQHVPLMDAITQEMYFKDFKFYNIKLSYHENKKIKQLIAAQLGYKGDIYHGAVFNNMLYLYEIATADAGVCRYHPGGVIIAARGFTHKFKFTAEHYRKKTYVQRKQFFNNIQSYTSVEARMSYVLEKYGKSFGSIFYLLEYSHVENCIYLTGIAESNTVTLILKRYFEIMTLQHDPYKIQLRLKKDTK